MILFCPNFIYQIHINKMNENSVSEENIQIKHEWS